MSLTRNHCHIVFATKRRAPALNALHKTELYAYINGITQNKKCKLVCINGSADHIHMIVEIHPSISLADYVKAVKQSTTLWLKEHPGFPQFDKWAEGYFAESISARNIDSAKQYIRQQDEHHAIYPFSKEIENLISRNNLILREDGLY